MNQLHKSLILASITAVSVATFASAAHARSIGGLAGRAHNPSQTNDFAEQSNGIENISNETARWDIPLVVDAAGGYDFTINVIAKGDPGSVSCEAQAADERGTIYFTSGRNRSPASSDVPFALRLNGIDVPDRGSLEVACGVGPGSQIINVLWLN